MGELAKLLCQFLSTPSARRATHGRMCVNRTSMISIHALREEGDVEMGISYNAQIISIHALREEGDQAAAIAENRLKYISIHALREEGDWKSY